MVSSLMPSNPPVDCAKVIRCRLILFLFVADGLSKVLHDEVVGSRIEGVRVCRRAPVISHLLFADE
jgi:hypothetical protein